MDSFYLMEKIDTTIKTLTPVHNTSGCIGHLLQTAKGRAYAGCTQGATHLIGPF